jgi:hypothetical protein
MAVGESSQLLTCRGEPTMTSSVINQGEPIPCSTRRPVARVASIIKTVGAEEIAMATSDRGDGTANRGLTRSERLAGLGVDWWATIVAGVVVLLAVGGLLPKIPW